MSRSGRCGLFYCKSKKIKKVLKKVLTILFSDGIVILVLKKRAKQ
jgi:hypothetical protein